MNRDQKTAAIEDIASQIKEAEAVFAVDYRGLSVPQAAELRGRLRDADARFRVVKNTLTERAADRAGVEAIKELLDGPTALTFVRGDVAVAAKAIADYGRAIDGLLPFKGGLLGEEVLTVEQLRSLARLPARDVLHGQLVGVISSPVTGLVRTLNALISGLAVQLGQIAEQGLVAGEPPAEAQAPAEQAEAEARQPAPEAESDAEPKEPAPVQPDQAEGEDDQAETGQPEGQDVPGPAEGESQTASEEAPPAQPAEETSSSTDDNQAQAPKTPPGAEQDKE